MSRACNIFFKKCCLSATFLLSLQQKFNAYGLIIQKTRQIVG